MRVGYSIIASDDRGAKAPDLGKGVDGDGDGDGDYVINAAYWIIGSFHSGPTPIGYLDGHVFSQLRTLVSRMNAMPGTMSAVGSWTTELSRIWGKDNWFMK